MALKILMLCVKNPWPPKDGGAIAMLNMIRGFHKAGHKVTVVAVNTPKHYVFLRNIPDDIQRLAEYYTIEIDTSVKWRDVMANLMFSKESYHVQRFRSKNFRWQLERILEAREFDVIQIETLFMGAYIDSIRAKAPKALVALRAHNIEHEIWDRRAKNEENPIKQYVFKETAVRIKKYEQTFYKKNPYDVLVPITGRDAGILKKLGAIKPAYVCQVGMDFDILDTRPVELEYPSVFYIGALDWEPNREGLDWFLKEVWPKVHPSFPQVKFFIAGRNMPNKYLSIRQDNIVVLGEVPSASEFIKSKAVMVVPIFSGSGMRVKIVEGMAYGKPIVATPMAAEGMSAKHGNNIMLAQTAEDFADRVRILIEQRSIHDTISARARSFVKSRFDNDSITKGLLGFYEKQLAGKRKRQKDKE
ncbi:MAG: glycosyltransferase family 4 protein [Bacteroidota bacterium]